MQTLLLDSSQSNIAAAAQCLKDGQLVAIPTETVYGLAANALSDSAVAQIFAAKGRPQDNPLISHIADFEMLPLVASHVPEQAYQLARAFWPGPLTMVLPRSAMLSNAVCAGLNTAAVRMPSHPVALAVIRACGVPLAAPSANVSGSPSPTTAQDVYNDLNGKVPLILDGGACSVGVESTVLSLVGDVPVLLRPGFVTKEQMEAVLGMDIEVSSAVLTQLKEGESAASPGMKYKHYAPQAQVVLVKGNLQQFVAYVNSQKRPNTVCMCFTGEESAMPCLSIAYGDAQNEAQQAQQVFGALRKLDAMGASHAFVRCPSEYGVGMAVYNRLLRAAAFQVVNL